MHFGGVLKTGVRGSGKLLNCHVVTPFGDDIAVIGETNYPYFNVTMNPGHSVCDVAIGPIEAKLLGDWEIYATFDSSVLGFMHVCQPLNLFLYGKYYSYDTKFSLIALGILAASQYNKVETNRIYVLLVYVFFSQTKKTLPIKRTM